MNNLNNNKLHSNRSSRSSNNNSIKDNVERFEYWVTDMAEHKYLRKHGIRYNFVKVMGRTTVYKYPRTLKVLELAKQYSLSNPTVTEYWVVDMIEHKLLRDNGIGFSFVKTIDNLTIYKYPKSQEVYDIAIAYTLSKNKEVTCDESKTS